MVYMYIVWIVLVLFVALGTFVSTRLYARYRESNHRPGNRLNMLESVLYHQQSPSFLSCCALVATHVPLTLPIALLDEFSSIESMNKEELINGLHPYDHSTAKVNNSRKMRCTTVE